MEVKTCEQYVLDELKRTQQELEKVKEEFEEFKFKAFALGVVEVHDPATSDEYYLELRKDLYD